MILGLFLLVLVGGVLLALIAGVIVALRRSAPPPKSGLPPRPDVPMRVEQVERISREIEKVNAMEAAGRISAADAAELRAALEGERREWTEKCAEFARESGAAAAALARKRLTKSNNAVLAGVCGGLAEWLGLDATLVRVGYVLLSLCTTAFPGLILYIVLWIVMPPPKASAVTATAAGGMPTSTPAARMDGGPGKRLGVFLVCLLAVPFVLLMLAAAMFWLKRTAIVQHDRAMEQVQNAEQRQAETVAKLTRNRPPRSYPRALSVPGGVRSCWRFQAGYGCFAGGQAMRC